VCSCEPDSSEEARPLEQSLVRDVGPTPFVGERHRQTGFRLLSTGNPANAASNPNSRELAGFYGHGPSGHPRGLSLLALSLRPVHPPGTVESERSYDSDDALLFRSS